MSTRKILFADYGKNIWGWAVDATLIAALTLMFVSGQTQAAGSKEYKLKAAYLYQFAKFVTWPNDSSRKMTIGIVGKDSFGDSIKTIEGKGVQGKTVSIKHMDSAREIGNCCQIVYFSSAADMENSGKGSILTVGEGKGFTGKGGMIGFIKRGTKLKFIVNVKAAEQAGLKISSRLLKVAIIAD